METSKNGSQAPGAEPPSIAQIKKVLSIDLKTARVLCYLVETDEVIALRVHQLLAERIKMDRPLDLTLEGLKSDAKMSRIMLESIVNTDLVLEGMADTLNGLYSNHLHRTAKQN